MRLLRRLKATGYLYYGQRGKLFMSKDIEQARQDILKILLDEYGLKTLENFEEIDGELMAEIYEQLKCVQEEYQLSDIEMEEVMDGI